MKKALVGLLLLVAMIGDARASGYSDFNAAIAARTDRNPADTIRFATQALSAPDLPEHLRSTAFWVRAQAYALSEQYDLAIADYGSTLANRPAKYDVLIERGSIYLTQKKYDLARADFQAAIHLRPELDWGYVSEAAANLAEERYDDAIKNYDDALVTSPDHTSLILMRGEANRLAHRYAQAVADFNAAIHKDSKYVAAYRLRAFAYLESGDARQAVSDYEQALDLDPNDLALRENAGIAQWDNGDYRDAAKNFEKSATDPKNAKRVMYSELWLHLATVKRGDDDTELGQRTNKLDLKTWPGPLLSLFIGTTTVDDVLSVAKHADADARNDQSCQASFFVAEWHLEHSEIGAAGPLLEQARATCRRELPEANAARAELKRLAP